MLLKVVTLGKSPDLKLGWGIYPEALRPNASNLGAYRILILLPHIFRELKFILSDIHNQK